MTWRCSPPPPRNRRRPPTNLTGQSPPYLDSVDIRHQILAVSEGEGIGQAAYPLKLLQSEGVLRHATVDLA